MTSSAHHLLSSYRETLIEHLFVGDLMRVLWRHGPIRAEIMKPQVDDAGYDLVVECNGVTRHVQIKASFIGSTTRSQKVHLHLTKKPSGCVVWILFDPETLQLGPYLFYGDKPGVALPSLAGFKTARHTKGDAKGVKAERPMIRVVPKGSFKSIDQIESLVALLFGIHDL